MIRPWFDHDSNVSQKFAKWSWLLPIVADFRQWSRLAPFGSSLVNQTDAMSCESSVYTTARDKLSNISKPSFNLSPLNSRLFTSENVGWLMKVACIYNKLLLAKAGTTASGEPLKSNQSSCLCKLWYDNDGTWRDMTGQCSREVINNDTRPPLYDAIWMIWIYDMNRIESICVIDASDHGTRPFCERRFQCPAQVARGAKQSGEGPGMREWEHAMAAASPSRKDKDSCERFQSSTYAAGSITYQHCRHYSIHFKTSLYIKHGFKRFKKNHQWTSRLENFGNWYYKGKWAREAVSSCRNVHLEISYPASSCHRRLSLLLCLCQRHQRHQHCLPCHLWRHLCHLCHLSSWACPLSSYSPCHSESSPEFGLCLDSGPWTKPPWTQPHFILTHTSPKWLIILNPPAHMNEVS